MAKTKAGKAAKDAVEKVKDRLSNITAKFDIDRELMAALHFRAKGKLGGSITKRESIDLLADAMKAALKKYTDEIRLEYKRAKIKAESEALAELEQSLSSESA